MKRSALVFSKGDDVLQVADETAELLKNYGFNVKSVMRDDADGEFDENIEIVIVIGGDGTILRAAELVYGTDVPILGINLGHMGFLAESERKDLPQSIMNVVNKDYAIEQRSVLQIEVFGENSYKSWALNEAVVEKAAKGKMIDVALSVQDEYLTSFACDGVIFASSTGSTAYAFSGGGPIVYPDVEQILMVPLAAYSLFNKPLSISTNSSFELDILHTAYSDATLTCDGIRQFDLTHGSKLRVYGGKQKINFARIGESSFSKRLRNKFSLPQKGWREN
ncbi:MAG: NAD kinase [Bifidobacteriaceae bacterium]|jgi:NAD+ kinase|nr:NAD kinase [Bifidobacteriaceae bacterium]